MMRTMLAALIGATIALGAFAGCTTTSDSEPVVLQTDTRDQVTLMLPQVDPEPLPDIRAIAAQQEREEAAQREAAERETAPKLTCDPTADAKVVGNIIVNKDCPDLTAAKEKAQRDYAEGYPLGGAEGLASERAANAGEGSMPDGGMTSGETQYEYGCSQGYITEGC